LGNSAFQAAWVPFQPSVLTVLGAYFGGDVAGFVLENLGGGLQLVGPRRDGRLNPEAASPTDRRGEVNLLAIQSLMMLIRHEVVGQFRLADGGPHDTEAAEPAFEAILAPS
jgi:hypothetical protein